MTSAPEPSAAPPPSFAALRPSVRYDPHDDGCSDTPRDFTPPRPTSLDPVETSTGSFPAASAAEPDPAALTLEYQFRHSFWSTRRAATMDALVRAETPAGSMLRFTRCGCNSWVYKAQDESGRYRVSTDKCHSRWCEACQSEHRRLVARNLAAKLVEVLELRDLHSQTDKLRFITLTLKTSDTSLSDQLDRLYAAFATLRSRSIWKRNVLGGILFLELTISKEGRWHPHLHVIVAGKYLPQPLLREAWLAITGDSYIVDVRLVRNPAIAASYVAKYASKVVPSGLVYDRARFLEAIIALRGRRTFNALGGWSGWKLSKPPPDDCSWELVTPLWHLLQLVKAGDAEARRILSKLRQEPAHENETPAAAGPAPSPLLPVCPATST